MSVDEVSIAITLASADKNNLEAVRKTLMDIKKLDEDLDLTNMSKNIGGINWGKLLGDAGLDSIKKDVEDTKNSLTDVVRKIDTIQGILQSSGGDDTKKAISESMGEYMSSISDLIKKSIGELLQQMPSSGGIPQDLKTTITNMQGYVREIYRIQGEMSRNVGGLQESVSTMSSELTRIRGSVSNVANEMANIRQKIENMDDEDDDDDDDDMRSGGGGYGGGGGGGYGGGRGGSGGGSAGGISASGRTGGSGGYTPPEPDEDEGSGGSISINIPTIGEGNTMTDNVEQIKGTMDDNGERFDRIEQKIDESNNMTKEALKEAIGIFTDVSGRRQMRGRGYLSAKQEETETKKYMTKHGIEADDIEDSVLDKDDV